MRFGAKKVSGPPSTRRVGRAIARPLALATLLLSGCASTRAGATPAPSVTAAPAVATVPLVTPAPTETPSSTTGPAMTSSAVPPPATLLAPSPSPTHIRVETPALTRTSAPTMTPTPLAPLAVVQPTVTRSAAATEVPAAVAPTPHTPLALAPTAVAASVPALATSAGSPLAVPAGALRLTGREHSLYAAASAHGRDAAIFTIAGDSNSEWSGYLGQIATGVYDLRARPAYAAAAVRFGPSFPRRSVAVAGGLRAADMFVPDWPDKPSACAPSEGRFTCELRLSRASIVFIQLGTGDRFAWTEYEGHLRRMLDVALQSGALPVLVTKADDLESWQGGAPIDHMNTVVRRLAAEYQVPMIDFFLATRGLPVIPNPQLPDRPFTKNGLLDEWGYYFHLSDLGKEMRILTTLAMLAAIAN